MHLLFVHRAFGRLALEPTRRHGWKCTCAFEHLSRCPSPSAEMGQRFELLATQPGPVPLHSRRDAAGPATLFDRLAAGERRGGHAEF
jgi:hypothetical protein